MPNANRWVHVGRLRRKLGDVAEIMAWPGRGYEFNPEEENRVDATVHRE
jgi:hypothetical protein